MPSSSVRPTRVVAPWLLACCGLIAFGTPAPAADAASETSRPRTERSAPADARPEEETSRFKAGDGVVWNSKTHPKAHGFGIQLRYPRSWKAAEGEGTNIVQKFLSRGGAGSEVVIVSVRPLGMPPGQHVTLEDAVAFVAPERARRQIPVGATLLSHHRASVDGELCARLEYEIATPNATFRRVQKTRLFFVPGRTSLLMIQCSVTADPGNTVEDVRKRFDTMSPLFDLIASTCVLDDKWTGRGARTPVAAPSPPGK